MPSAPLTEAARYTRQQRKWPCILFWLPKSKMSAASITIANFPGLFSVLQTRISNGAGCPNDEILIAAGKTFEPSAIPWRRSNELIDSVEAQQQCGPEKALLNCLLVLLIHGPANIKMKAEEERSKPVEEAVNDLRLERRRPERGGASG